MSPPAKTKYVRLLSNLASPSALLVLQEGAVYRVDSETKTSYRLSNIQTGHRIAADGVESTRLIPRKLWFEELDGEPTQDEIDGAHDTPAHVPPDPYFLRGELPPTAIIWEAQDDEDKYTGNSREWYESKKVPVDRDHMLEVQTASMGMTEVFPTTGSAIDERAASVAEFSRSFLNSTPNLNNTDAALNRWFKGVAVSEFNRRYMASSATGRRMRSEIDGLASLLRDKMKVASEKNAEWVSSNSLLQGRGVLVEATDKFAAISSVSEDVPQPLKYAPRFARNIEKEMGSSLKNFVAHLNQSDDSTFLDYSEKLVEIGRKMDLSL